MLKNHQTPLGERVQVLATHFYGWRVVGVCFVAAVLTWGFSVFGASVYLAEITRAQS
ncbi:MAG: hypothetical protein ACJAU6_002270 [Alphaproteobacteria bacterium]|jgi:hypothetical protein